MSARKLLLLATLCLLAGCHTYDESPAHYALYTQRQAEPSYTIIVSHDECTGCSDAYLVQGTLPIPADINDKLTNKSHILDLKMAGQFPIDVLLPDNLFDFGTSLKVTGKIIGIYSDEGTEGTEGTIPLFYVEKWAWSAIKK